MVQAGTQGNAETARSAGKHVWVGWSEGEPFRPDPWVESPAQRKNTEVQQQEHKTGQRHEEEARTNRRQAAAVRAGRSQEGQ